MEASDESMNEVVQQPSTSLREFLAEQLRANRREIVARWLDRISARVSLDDNRVFPTDELLNHVPLLIDGIAGFIERKENELDAAAPVTAKAMELGELRHSQGFDAYQILKEHELLVRIIFSTLRDSAAAHGASPDELLECWEEIGQAVELIRQATVSHFLRLAGERVKEREDRLRRFNRMVSHELKDRLGAVRGGAHMLEADWRNESERTRFIQMVIENSEGLQTVLANLEALSRLESDSRQRRNVLLPQAVAEVVREMRDTCSVRGVTVIVSETLPPVEVDAAATELCLTNLVSNAIKYCDKAKPERWVRIDAELRFPSHTEGELIVKVSDNGVGVPASLRAQLFRRFFRAHAETVTDAEGSGLGLNIVRETAESLGGTAWAEFPDDGTTVFAFSFPSRREEDAAAAGVRRVGAEPV